MDRYYSSKEVFELLLKKEIYACGTINPSRVGITEEIKLEIEYLKNENAIFYIDGKILLCVWRTHKEKLVYVLSTLLDNSLHKSERYCIEEKTKIQIKRPTILEAYNENMRGVDYFDRDLRFYSFIHGSKKWYQKIDYYFLEAALLNSYIIYQNESGKVNCFSRKRYIIEIIYSLLKMRKEKRRSVKRSDCSLTRRDQPRNCAICNIPGKKRRKRTRYYCTACSCYVCAERCFDNHRK